MSRERAEILTLLNQHKNPQSVSTLKEPCGCALEWGRHKIEARGIQMLYKKINVELIVIADEAEAVVAELNAALDRLEERHTLFGGGIETVAVEHPGTRKRSALAHSMAAGERAVRAARESLTIAFRAVI